MTEVERERREENVTEGGSNRGKMKGRVGDEREKEKRRE